MCNTVVLGSGLQHFPGTAAKNLHVFVLSMGLGDVSYLQIMNRNKAVSPTPCNTQDSPVAPNTEWYGPDLKQCRGWEPPFCLAHQKLFSAAVHGVLRLHSIARGTVEPTASWQANPAIITASQS